MPTALGAHNARVDFARSLLTKKGRLESGRFSFEGPTLLEEAVRSGVPIEEVFVSAQSAGATPALEQLERSGVNVYAVDDRTMRRISDVETPSGIVAIAPAALQSLETLLEAPGVVLLLADVNDPGNAGTLLRSADAFGVDRVVFGSLGVEPYNPKVVRAAMGSLFRCRAAVAEPDDLRPFLDAWQVTGLTAAGAPLSGVTWPARCLLAVGSERRGLGRWEPLCGLLAAVEMPGTAESLNAAVAGSIALYEASKAGIT